MSGKRLQWIFDLVDRMSPQSRKMSRALSQVETRLERIDKAIKRAETSGTFKGVATGADKARSAVERLAKATERAQAAASAGGAGSHRRRGMFGGWPGNILGTYFGAQMAWSMAKGLGSVVLGPPAKFMQQALEAGSYTETNRIAFRTILGSDTKADATMKEAVAFAAKTPFTTKQTIGWYKDLLTGGFKANEISPVLQGVGDLAALRDFNPEVLERVLLAFRQIKAKGVLQGEELSQQLAEAGVPVGKVYEKLSKLYKMPVPEVLKAITARRVSADTGVWAVLETLKELSGGKLGNLMDQFSRTLPGLWSTLKSRPFELLMGIEKSPAFAKWKVALQNAVDVLDPESASGQRIITRAMQMFDRITGGLVDRFQNKDAVEAWVNRLIDGFERMIPAAGRLADTTGRIAANLDKVGTAMDLWSSPVDFIGGKWLVDLRRAKSGGVETGERGMRFARYRQLLEAGGFLGGAEEAELEQLRREFGGGASSTARPTHKRGAAVAGPDKLSATIHVNVPGATAADAAAVKAAARAGAMEALAMFGDQLALEVGVG
jgi:hypothetical protein